MLIEQRGTLDYSFLDRHRSQSVKSFHQDILTAQEAARLLIVDNDVCVWVEGWSFSFKSVRRTMPWLCVSSALKYAWLLTVYWPVLADWNRRFVSVILHKEVVFLTLFILGVVRVNNSACLLVRSFRSSWVLSLSVCLLCVCVCPSLSLFSLFPSPCPVQAPHLHFAKLLRQIWHPN